MGSCRSLLRISCYGFEPNQVFLHFDSYVCLAKNAYSIVCPKRKSFLGAVVQIAAYFFFLQVIYVYGSGLYIAAGKTQL